MTGALTLPEASTSAVRVDGIFLLLSAMSVAVILLVGGLVTVFAIRYRRGSRANRADMPAALSSEFEIGWTAATFFLFLFIFWWVTSAQLTSTTPPKDALEIHVVGKQWMWKTQHPTGAREIDALHVPVGRPVKLVMTSQDTIHDFYVPAFRMKQDVLPGRYTQEWFQATKTGVYPIECAEYCGTDHAKMGGLVTVMSPQDYARWTAAQPNADTLANQGARLYARLGCANCHGGEASAGAGPAGGRGPGGVQGPSLAGLYGSKVRLTDGRIVTADEAYLHDSLVQPERYPVAGWPAAMPSYARAVDEEELVELVAYLKSLSARPGEGS